jgi:hypothetical protein
MGIYPYCFVPVVYAVDDIAKGLFAFGADGLGVRAHLTPLSGNLLKIGNLPFIERRKASPDTIAIGDIRDGVEGQPHLLADAWVGDRRMVNQPVHDFLLLVFRI